jgi:phospholipid/cholesterol/gamma-HCH transport system substrate-binding protein
MKDKPWVVGLFIVVGVSLFAAVLFLIGNRREAFSRHRVVYAEFADLSGLASGAKVRVSGFDAGQVGGIEIPGDPAGRFRVELRIERRLGGLVRMDSMVAIETDGVVGDRFVAISKGTSGSAEAAEGAVLPSREPLQLAAIVEKGSALIDDIRGALKEILREGGARTLGRTLSNLDRSTGNLVADTEALKHNLLFRGFFKKRGFFDLDSITPDAYREACAKQKDVGTRKWIGAAGFVAGGGGGKERLSAAGRVQIDAAVSGVVESLPGTAIIVEGYATGGSPDREFVVSRDRAELVRLYLEDRFHLSPDDLGIVPLLGLPPQGSGRDRWDGAAIMLLSKVQEDK